MAFDFEKLDVYQKALNYANDIYNLTKDFPSEDRFEITSQLRRASLSISLNIAEGSGRTKKEFKHFLLIARTSAQKCVPLLTIAQMQEYIEKEKWRNYIIELRN